MSSAVHDFILQPKEFRLLEGLRLNPRKSFSGRVRGERLTRRKGISIEFADFRDYTEGDDLRHMDWNVLARLETPVIKTYQDEEDLAVYLLLDASPSMEFGEPSKLEYGKRLLSTVGYAGLSGQDAVAPRCVGPRERPLPFLRGRAAFPRLAAWVKAASPGADVSLSSALRAFAGSKERAGLLTLISDGLDPETPGMIRLLTSRGHQVDLLQVLTPEELDPDLEGDLRLLDAETGAVVEITANSLALKSYKENLAKHCEALEATCTRHGGRYALIRTDEDLADVISQKLKRQGWLTA
ncbi:MAG TPA: DUF58 domain-containing protein [Fimbriimonadaceae bacterium]|nr:DUF58 domain-containing protein [Fimbriimonadaceae bacterium]